MGGNRRIFKQLLKNQTGTRTGLRLKGLPHGSRNILRQFIGGLNAQIRRRSDDGVKGNGAHP